MAEMADWGMSWLDSNWMETMVGCCPWSETEYAEGTLGVGFRPEKAEKLLMVSGQKKKSLIGDAGFAWPPGASFE